MGRIQRKPLCVYRLVGTALAVLCTLAVARSLSVEKSTEAAHKADPTPAQIATLIASLDDSDFNVRERAQRELIELGDAAWDQVELATTSDKPELQRRAKDILGALSARAQLACIKCDGVIDCVAPSPDGKRVVGGYRRKATVCMWEVTTGKRLKSYEERPADDLKIKDPLTGRYERWEPLCGIRAVAFSRDGKRVAAGGICFLVALDSQSFEETPRLAKPSGTASEIAITSTSREILICDYMSLSTFDLENGKELDYATRVFFLGLGERRFPSGPCALPASRTGNAIVYDEGKIEVWSLSEGKRIYCLEGRGKKISLLRMSDDQKTIAALNGDGTLDVWRLPGKSISYSYDPAHGKARSVALQKDGIRMLVGDDFGRIFLFDLDKRRIIRHFAGHSKDVCDVAFAHDAPIAVSCSEDETIRTWKLPK